MSAVGLQRGDEAYVSIRINKILAMDVVVQARAFNELSCEIYGEADADTIAVAEALKAALGGVDFLLERPRLRRLLQERIAQLKAEEEDGQEVNPPAPPPDLSDIPF